MGAGALPIVTAVSSAIAGGTAVYSAREQKQARDEQRGIVKAQAAQKRYELRQRHLQAQEARKRLVSQISEYYDRQGIPKPQAFVEYEKRVSEQKAPPPLTEQSYGGGYDRLPPESSSALPGYATGASQVAQGIAQGIDAFDDEVEVADPGIDYIAPSADLQLPEIEPVDAILDVEP